MASENEGGAGGDAGAGAGSAADLLGGTGGSAGAGAGAGAGTGGDAGAGAGGDAGGAVAGSPEWYANLSADPFGEGAAPNRDYVASKGWKTMDDVVKSYREAEHSLRNGNRVAVPGEGASAEEVAAFRSAIGVPEDASGYKIDAPMGADGNPLPLRTAIIERLAGKALEAGMPAAAFNAVVGDYIQLQVEEAAGIEAERIAEANAWVKAQGAAGDEKLTAITRAAEIFGLNRSDLIAMRNALGAAKSMDVLSKIGLGLREDVMTDAGSRQNFGLSGREAQAQIDTLRADPAWSKRANQPGTPENLQYKRLLNMAGDAANREAQAA